MFKVAGLGFALAIAALPQTGPAAQVAHVWEKQEITLKAQNSYPSPYLSVDVWVDLAGPGFKKRVYGFWDGENTFRVRIVATAPGQWSWKSGSNPADPGLSGKSGSFRAVAWSEADKEAIAEEVFGRLLFFLGPLHQQPDFLVWWIPMDESVGGLYPYSQEA